jgi:hypothetical protein
MPWPSPVSQLAFVDRINANTAIIFDIRDIKDHYVPTYA